MRLLPLTAAILTAPLLAFGLAACGKPPAAAAPAAMPPTPVGVATPIGKTLPVTRELTGRIEAMQVVDLRPRVGGIIKEVLVADGAEVKAGEVLFKIDEAPLKTALARAEADVARTTARRSLAQKIIVRLQKLLDDKIIAQQGFDDAQSALAAASAEEAASVAALESAQLDLSYANITAPIAGRIGKVLANAGNLAQASGPAPGTLLATLVSIDPVYAVFDLDEGTWRAIGPRLRASADAHGTGSTAVPVHVALPGEQGFPHVGAVTFVDNQIDGGSGSIRIRAQMPNTDQVLTPGAFARIELEVAPARPVLLINERAVLAQLTTRYVFAVDEKGITSFRPVQLGEAVGALRVVNGGLAPTDKIAVNNLAKIFYPGMPVTALPASMETTDNDAPPAAATPGAAPVAAKPEGK